MARCCQVQFDFCTQSLDGIGTVAITGVWGRFKLLLLSEGSNLAILSVIVGGYDRMVPLRIGQRHIYAVEVTDIVLSERVQEDRHLGQRK